MIDNNLQEIMDLFGVDETTAEKMVKAGFRTGEKANEIAANMFYDDAGLNEMFGKVKKDFDGLKSEEGLED
jgi:hypothetical protein